MKTACFIIPYFGHFPNYFKLFLKTCGYNKKFNWLIFTDNSINFGIPSNVRFVHMTFDELREIIQSKFEFSISLDFPYKLCDYKPAYGYIFENYLKEYLFWGHCDIDVLMGDLSSYLTNEILDKYDKLFCMGHCTLYKNNPEINRGFMLPLNGRKVYKDAFTKDYIYVFDEECRTKDNVNRIFKKNGFAVYEEDLSLNFSIFKNKFYRTKYIGFDNKANGFIVESDRTKLVTWESGHIFRYILKQGMLCKEEFMYLHLQERHMKFDEKLLEYSSIKIIPDSFLPLSNRIVDKTSYEKEKIDYLNFHLFHRFVKENRRRYNKLRKIIGLKS